MKTDMGWIDKLIENELEEIKELLGHFVELGYKKIVREDKEHKIFRFELKDPNDVTLFTVDYSSTAKYKYIIKFIGFSNSYGMVDLEALSNSIVCFIDEFIISPINTCLSKNIYKPTNKDLQVEKENSLKLEKYTQLKEKLSLLSNKE